MIGYAIWDRTSQISDRFLRNYIRDTFHEIKLDFGDVPVHHDIEQLIDDCRHSHLVVFHSGHTSRNPQRLRESVERLCLQDFMVAGHIIHHAGSYPCLNPQMFVLNMGVYRAFGSPAVGHFENSEIVDLRRPERSPENVHDDYTPLWLRPAEGTQPVSVRNFGWHLIHASLSQGIPVVNLPDDIRSSKRYLYPGETPGAFAGCLRKLAQDDLAVVPDGLSPNQRSYLEELLRPGTACRTFLFNTERMDVPVSVVPALRLFGLASGFKLFVLWHRLGGVRQVVYYDHNYKSLAIWEDIVRNWSGRDFEAFCRARRYADDFFKMGDVIAAFGGEDALADAWNDFQRCDFKFVRCDLLKDPQTLVGEMSDYGNVVWYSNCFKYFEGIRRYGIQGCEDRRQAFLGLVNDRAPDTLAFP